MEDTLGLINAVYQAIQVDLACSCPILYLVIRLLN